MNEPLTVGKCRRIFNLLPQVSLNAVNHGNRLVNFWIRSLCVGSDINNILSLLVDRHPLLDLAGPKSMLCRGDCGHDSGSARKNVNCWKMILLRELPRKDNVSIQNRACGICDGLIHVIAIDKHRIKTGNTLPIRASSCTLKQARKGSEDTRSVAF